VSDFKKLHVWQKALALSLAVDRVCKKIRGVQYASLRSQLFRAATSIPANIAEGRRQESEKEFARFLRYALNSSSELESHLIVARGCEAISEDDFRSLVTQTIRVRKMLYALLKRLAVDGPPSPAQVRAHKTARTKPLAGPPEAPGR
jgi:four helix bundle protein